MHAPIDLSISPDDHLALHVDGWPAEARGALINRVGDFTSVTGVVDAGDRLLVSFPREQTNVSAVRKYVRQIADELLPDRGLLYRD